MSDSSRDNYASQIGNDWLPPSKLLYGRSYLVDRSLRDLARVVFVGPDFVNRPPLNLQFDVHYFLSQAGVSARTGQLEMNVRGHSRALGLLKPFRDAEPPPTTW